MYRYGRLCWRIVTRMPVRLSKPRHEAMPLNLLMMMGAGQVDQAVCSLASIAMTWNMLPALTVVSDGTLDFGLLKRALHWWPHPIECISRDAVLQYHAHMGREDIVRFANAHIFGLKLAVILHSSVSRPTLYCDTDFLWQKGPPSLPSRCQGAASMRMALDCEFSYDPDLLNAGKCGILMEGRFLNAGLIYIDGDPITGNAVLAELVAMASRAPMKHSEQTIFAIASELGNQPAWSREEVLLTIEDSHRPILPDYRRQTWCGRHYVSPVRHLFWRDALLMRLGMARVRTNCWSIRSL